MRWVMASLLIVNIVVFVYFLLFSKVEPFDVAATTKDESHIASIKLLSEIESGSSLAAVRTSLSREVDSPAIIEPICTLVGSFEKESKAESFVERLLGLGLEAEVKNILVEGDPRYWLHLPPEASRKEALRRLSELQVKGIDSYVIPSGSLANGVSLGMFSKKDRAEVMFKKVEKQGYSPQIASVPRETKEIWVFLKQGEAAKLTRKRWAELLSSGDYIQKRQNLCADVAYL